MSSDEIRLVSDKRTEFGKGAARKLRRADKVPAVLYGHGEAPVHLALPFHDTFQALKNPNALLTIAVEGESDQLALAKDVQRDPIKPIIEHVDLVIVKRGEKVTVEVPVQVEGDAAPETVVTVDNATLEIEADVTNLPEALVVSVEGLEVGTQILAGQVEMPAGSTLVSDPERVLAMGRSAGEIVERFPVTDFERAWAAGETRSTRLVVIGLHDMDEQAVRAAIAAAV